ncbi:c-type cytochrome [uncultured Algoriphagus sp.]|uniref:c-type cytochrome n=1 Tax=uncultured Algoriphagus sp. TaxID=417365 RepID=UPI0030EDCB81|tara:strand:- start:28885 stop:29352 length:468 start_codon:yes stop_codon:yes gene_type:complete
MKIKTISKSAAVVFAVLLFACGGGETTSEKSSPAVTAPVVESAEPTPPIVEEPIVEEEKVEEIIDESSSVGLTGEAKIGNSDCLSCHLVERKVVGPSFKEIAAEYKPSDENITKLANKIIKGGAGVWGEAAMSPHPTLSEEDAKDMVRYILSLYE